MAVDDHDPGQGSTLENTAKASRVRSRDLHVFLFFFQDLHLSTHSIYFSTIYFVSGQQLIHSSISTSATIPLVSPKFHINLFISCISVVC